MSLNPQELIEVFQHTNNPVNEIREQAERRLAEIERVESYVPTLLRLTGEQSIHGPIRQLVAIRFKNHVKKRWKNDGPGNEENDFAADEMIDCASDSSDEPSLSQADKKIIQDLIYEACVTQNEPLIRKQLLEAFYTICRMEFPARFESLMPSIARDLALSEQHAARVFGSISALRMLCKKYKYKMRKTVRKIEVNQHQKNVMTQASLDPDAQDIYIRRNTLDDIIEATWPRLEQIASNLVQIQNNNNVYEMVKPIFQIFYYGIHMGLPMYLQQNEQAFNKWMEIFLAFLRQPIPEEVIANANKQETSSGVLVAMKMEGVHPFSKAQKWAMRCVTRIFNDHGRYQYVPANLKQFAQNFQHQMAPIFLDCVLNNILKVYAEHSTNGKGNFSSVVYYKTLSAALAYITMCIHYSNLCKKLLENFEMLLSQILYPLTCLNKNDLELWNDNPHEFVKSLYCDFDEEQYDPRSSALRAIVSFVRIRSQYTANPVLEFMSTRVREYDDIVAQCGGNFENPMVQQAAIQKDGALNVLGELQAQIRKGGEELTKPLEDLLRSHVLPDFSNGNVGFLRFRACKFVGQYFGMKLSDERLRYQCAECVTNCLNDPQLPVRLEAANAFPTVIIDDGVLKHLAATIPAILERYLLLMDEIGLEHVMSTFDVMIDRLGDNLAPFAEQLTDRMIIMFNKLHEEIQETDDENEKENLILSAGQVLKSITTIVRAVHPLRPLLRTIQMKLFPVFERYFNQHNGDNYVMELLDVIGVVTFYDGPDLHPFFWERVLPNIIEMHMSWCSDYLNRVVNILATFVNLRNGANLTEFMLTDGSTKVDFVDLFLQLFVHSMKRKVDSEAESLGALADVIFSFLRQGETSVGNPNAQPSPVNFRLHKYIPHLMRECNAVLNEVMTPKCQNLALRFMGCMMFYDVAFFIKVAMQLGILESLIIKFNENMRDMNWQEQKVVVFAFGQLLSMDLGDVPPPLLQKFPDLIDMIATLVCMMNYCDEEDEDDAQESDEDTDSSSGDEDIAGGDDGEDDEDEDDDDDDDDSEDEESENEAFLSLDINEDYTDENNLNETAKATAILQADDEEIMRFLEQFGDDENLPSTPFADNDEVIAFNLAVQALHQHNPEIVETWKRNVGQAKLDLLEQHLKVANDYREDNDRRKMKLRQKNQESESRLHQVMREATDRQRQTRSPPWLT